MRVPWPNDFPAVCPHTSNDILFGHKKYLAAKRGLDVGAAWDICDDVASDELMYRLWDELIDEEPRPLIVAPSKPDGDNRNALSRTYAAWLAKELSCELSPGLFQTNTVTRDKETDPYVRLVQEPLFEGDVRPGRRYIIADDVCTMGGTMVSLRGFIETRGGAVIMMSCLAIKDGEPRQISLAAETKEGLINAYDGSLSALVNSELGYDVSCLSEPEGAFLLRASSVDEVRDGIRRARN